MGLTPHLKCCFQRIQEKNLLNFSLRDLSLVCFRLNVYRSDLIFRNLPWPEKFLVTRLILLTSLITGIISSYLMAPNSSSIFSTVCVNFLLESSFYVRFLFLTLEVSHNCLQKKRQAECGRISNIEKRSGKERKYFCYFCFLIN